MHSDFSELAEELESRLRAVLEAAPGARQSPTWAALRGEWLGAGEPVLSASGAVHASDMRDIFIAMHAAFAARLHRLIEEHGEIDEDWEFQSRRLPEFVRDESEKYIKSQRKAPSLGGVFARAAARTKVADGKVSAGVDMRKCRSCGAPRDVSTVYGDCSFCNKPFFPKE